MHMAVGDWLLRCAGDLFIFFIIVDCFLSFLILIFRRGGLRGVGNLGGIVGLAYA